jgi:hypothetical protein
MIFSLTDFVRRGAPLALLAAMVAGCSASNSPALTPGATAAQSSAQHQDTSMVRKLANGLVRRAAPANRGHGWMSPDAKRTKELFYWADFDTNTVTVYKRLGSANPKEVGTITSDIDEPERLFVDGSKNLWVSNLGNDTITEYARGATSPKFTISTDISNPTGLTVDSKGTVYVANVGNSTITEYPKGASSPSLTISSDFPEYLATDSSNNLYVSTLGSGVWEYPNGSSTGTDLNLSVGAPYGIEVDKAGNIIITDTDSSTIDVFPPGQTSPSEEISDSNVPFALSLAKNEKKLYASGETTGGSFVIQQLDYPKGTTLTDKITTGAGDWPIAVSPDNAL